MSATTSPEGSRRGILAVVVLVAFAVIAMSVWFVRRAAWEGDMAERLGSYASAALPTPDSPVDAELAEMGAEIFRRSCAACHTIGEADMVGPDLAGVTVRREYGWIRDMVLRPDSMTAWNPDAAALKTRYQVQMMVPGYLQNEHAMAVLEFLRQVDAGRAARPQG